jgi:hypothetical protein
MEEPLKSLQIPEEVVCRIAATLREGQQQSVGKVRAERSLLEARLIAIRGRMDNAHIDKLDGKIREDFCKR